MHLLVKMATRFLVLPALLAALALWYVRMGRGDETDGLVADATSKIAEEHFVYGALRDRQAQEAGLSALAASVPGGAAFWLAEGDLQRGYRLRKTMQGGALWARPDGAYWRVLGLEPDTPLRSAGLAPGAKIRARGGDLFFRCPLGVGRLILAGGVEAGESWEVLEKGQRRILTVTASEAGERGLGVRAYANGLLCIRCRVLSLQTALRLRRLLRPIEGGVSTLTLDLRGCWDGDEAGVRAWYRLLGAGEVRLRTGGREGFPRIFPASPVLAAGANVEVLLDEGTWGWAEVLGHLLVMGNHAACRGRTTAGGGGVYEDTLLARGGLLRVRAACFSVPGRALRALRVDHPLTHRELDDLACRRFRGEV